jgi:hypothetical protein
MADIDVEEVLAQLTLAEKCNLLSGASCSLPYKLFPIPM